MKTLAQMNTIRELHAQGGLEDVTLQECELEYASQFPEVEDGYNFDPTDTVENRLYSLMKEIAVQVCYLEHVHNEMTFTFATNECNNAQAFASLAGEDEDVECVDCQQNVVVVTLWCQHCLDAAAKKAAFWR